MTSPASLVAGTALVSSLLLITGCGSDGANTGTDSGAPATSESSPGSDDHSASEHGHRSSTPGESAGAPDTGDPTTSVGVTLEGQSVKPVAQTVEVTVGDTVELVVTADRPGELHVHSSPEQELSFGEGRSTVKVTVDRPGQVDVEEHESGTLVLRLLVQ